MAPGAAPASRAARTEPPPVPLAGAVPPIPEGRYLIVRGPQLVGTSRLEVPLADRRAAAGRLFPGEGLLAVLPVFRLYDEANGPEDLRRFLRKRDELRLRVLSARGKEYRATVELISRWSGNNFVVHVAMEDDRFWTGSG